MAWREAEGAAAPADEEQPLPAGTVIDGRYRLIAEIGAGGMGRVYEAEHMFLRRRMALKLLLRGKGSAEAAARMVQEAMLAGQVPHPAIVRVFDCADLGMGRVYVAMELLPGESLAQVLQRPGRAAQILPWLADVARGLAAAHRVGVVHRDVKPANVLLARDAAGAVQAKLLDFGVAKLLPGAGGAGGVQTEAGAVLGTPHYLAPEQARGDVIDGRADLYGLGVVLYEVLTGELPFVGDGFMAILAQHLNKPPLDPRQAAPERQIPDGVARLTMRLLAKDPQERPPDGDAVAEVIVALLTTERAALERVVTGPRTVGMAEGTGAGTVRLGLAEGTGAGTVRLGMAEGTGAGTVRLGLAEGTGFETVMLTEGTDAGTVRLSERAGFAGSEGGMSEETGAAARLDVGLARGPGPAGAGSGAWRSRLVVALLGVIAVGIGWAVVRSGRSVAEVDSEPTPPVGTAGAPEAASLRPPEPPAAREAAAGAATGAAAPAPATPAAVTAGARPEKPVRAAPSGKKSPRDSGTTRAPPPPGPTDRGDPGKADPGGPPLKTDVYDE